VAYDDRETAERVRDELAQLTREHVIEIDDAVVVTRDEKGKVKLHQTVNPAGAGAAGGALWGGLIGLIFLAPLLGAAIGALAGGAAGAVTDLGVDKVLPRISQYGGRVIQSSLSTEAEQKLQEALSATPASV
jgi:uncharacterized membrane protein